MTPKPTILLLPGLLCDAAVWRAQVDVLSSFAECRVADYGTLDSIPAMAEMLLADLPPRFMLAGHSMGGRVALEIYRRAQQRVERMALLDTGYPGRAGGTAGEDEAARRLALVDLARGKGMRAMGERWARGMVHPARLDDAELIDELLAMVQRKTPDVFAAHAAALLARPDAGALLPRIACPTLVACGRQDAWAPLPRHEEMARLIPGAILVVIENAGHMTTMERPAETAALLGTWFGGGRAASAIA